MSLIHFSTPPKMSLLLPHAERVECTFLPRCKLAFDFFFAERVFSRLLFDVPFRFPFRFFEDRTPFLNPTHPMGIIILYEALRYIKEFVRPYTNTWCFTVYEKKRPESPGYNLFFPYVISHRRMLFILEIFVCQIKWYFLNVNSNVSPSLCLTVLNTLNLEPGL